MNQPFTSPPQRPLIAIIHEIVKKGELIVFDPVVDCADQFRQVIEPDNLNRIGLSLGSIMQYDVVTGEEVKVLVKNELIWDRIIKFKFKIKEVWFFDINTGKMRVRILGLVPVMEDYSADGTYRGDMTIY